MGNIEKIALVRARLVTRTVNSPCATLSVMMITSRQLPDRSGIRASAQLKMHSGRLAETATLGRFTQLLTCRSTATLQMM